MTNIQQKIKDQYPGADVKVSLVTEEGPYIRYAVTLNFYENQYNPKFDATNPVSCACGHSYDRHFDSYENMAPVGCKYCGCGQYHRLPENTSIYERILHASQFDYSAYSEAINLLNSYIIQHELLNYQNLSLNEYLGIDLTKFIDIIENKFGSKHMYI